ncbi:MAG TPA: hypothetical protein VF984_04550 [Actinomycetota bacterium]
MTRQHLAGELSLILEELHAVPMDAVALHEVARLRREAETTPPATLAPVVRQAVELIDGVCWDLLTRGETEAFVREAAVYAELWEFGVCAGFLNEGRTNGVRGPR